MATAWMALAFCAWSPSLMPPLGGDPTAILRTLAAPKYVVVRFDTHIYMTVAHFTLVVACLLLVVGWLSTDVRLLRTSLIGSMVLGAYFACILASE